MNYIIHEDLNIIVNSDIEWQRFQDKSILITGANGFLPAYMVESLLYANKKFNLNLFVYCLVRNISKASQRFKDYLENKHLKFIHQDICSPININNNIDYIIHAASQASPKYYGTDPVGTLNANVIGTNNILEFSLRNRIESFLYFSSSEIYGSLNKNYIEEHDFGYLDCNTIRACYAESKRMGETMCKSWLHQYSIKTKIVRPFHTYGPGMDLNDGRVFADFVKCIIKGEDIILNSDGSAERSFCYLRDATLAFFKILLDGEIGEAYNMGNPHAVISIFNLAKIISSLSTKKTNVIRTNRFQSGYIPSSVVKNIPSISKLSTLNWEPTTSIEEGFSRTINSYI
jgi:nucleoside-diphosphate-sugar epimerase